MPQTAILRGLNKCFRESLTKPTFIFRGGLMLKSFAKSLTKKEDFRELRRNFRGVWCWNPAALAIEQPLCGHFERLPVV